MTNNTKAKKTRKDYQAIRHDFMNDELSKLFKKYQVFFAFSQKQLDEGLEKNNISKDEPLAEIVGGGILPKKNRAEFMKKFEALHDLMIEEIKKLDPEPVIAYELGNYESWYTGDISNAWEVLQAYGYTIEQVKKVFNKYGRA